MVGADGCRDGGQGEFDALAEKFHVPEVDLTFQMRVTNTDPHRLARILDITGVIEFPTQIWKFIDKGTFVIHGDRASFPIELKPGEAFVGTYTSTMEPNESLTQKNLAQYLKRQRRGSFPAQIQVLCDDTYDGVSESVVSVDVSLAPLKDKLEAHWSKSEYLK